MPAADESSATKMPSVSTICATRSGVIARLPRRRDRHAHTRTPQKYPRGVRDVVAALSVSAGKLQGTPVGRQRTPALLDVRFVFVAEMFQRREHRRDRRVPERTQRLAADVPGNAGEKIQVAELALAPFDLLQDLVEPVGAFATGRALAARFVAVEME